MDDFFCNYDLKFCRQQASNRLPAAHQLEALEKLDQWFYKKERSEKAGGFLVLPTGAGKTFTAVHFICSKLISEGYKVLWLAHTHHLLEQAFYSFASEVKHIAEPKKQLKVRVISGTPGHYSAKEIKASDDILIGTLQTVTRAYQKQTQLESFFKKSDGKLFVVFDEAHHSPAKTYCKLIEDIQERFPEMYLLGLTATPDYTNKHRYGWLESLFPQRILYQVTAQRLMSNGFLAKPEFEQHHTNIDAPEFDEKKYQKWINNNQDLPEDFINELARNATRNALIAEVYANERERYGKTIIFADTKVQCNQLDVALQEREVRVGVIYYLNDPITNRNIIEAFRHGDLDVLINIQMLTEGTDIPDTQTVFLTRQTKSSILLTQMIGRALRGPEAGGTDIAYIVSFIDNWKKNIKWAGYSINDGETSEAEIHGSGSLSAMPPIELIRKAAQELDRMFDVLPGTYLSIIPLGWYRVEFDNLSEGSEYSISLTELVLVYEDQSNLFKCFLDGICNMDIQVFASVDIDFETMRSKVEELYSEIYHSSMSLADTETIPLSFKGQVSESLLRNLFIIARHIAQSGCKPNFFDFEDRRYHDLETLAKTYIDANRDSLYIDRALHSEFHREDRYWKAFYSSYQLFTSHYNTYAERIARRRQQGQPFLVLPPRVDAEAILSLKNLEERKSEAQKRDRRCVCCGSKHPLDVRYIIPKDLGGQDILDNLQTLCHICSSSLSSQQNFSFLKHKTELTTRPSYFPEMEIPNGASNMKLWDEFWHRSFNFFYQCASVEEFISFRVGRKTYWLIYLHPNNEPSWVKPYIRELIDKIQQSLCEYGYIGIEMFIVNDDRVRARPSNNYGSEHRISIPIHNVGSHPIVLNRDGSRERIHAYDVDCFRRRSIALNPEINTEIMLDISAGDKIKVIYGPFKDFEGEVIENTCERRTIKAMLSIFGRDTPVELEYSQIQRHEC